MKPVEQLAVLLLFFFVAAYALAVSVYRPYHNWDMVMYIAAAKSFEEGDTKLLHAFTYDKLRYSVSKAEYEELVQGSYRRTISTDPSAFVEQLPFYQIRPLYTGVIYLLYKAGIDIGFATHIISGVAVVVAVAFLYLMSASFLGKPLIYAVPFLALIFGVNDLAKYSTPDGMAFLAMILSAYLYLKRRILLLLIFLPIMICIRTDLILFTFPLLFFIFAFGKGIRRKAALSIVMSVIVYVAVGAYWENPGWSTVFYFTLVEILTHPVSMPPTSTAHHYLYALFNGAKGLLDNKSFLLYGLVSSYSLYIIMNRTKTKSFFKVFNSPSVLLSIICILFVFSHFLAFPVAWDRFFSGPYLLGTFSLLVMMADYLKALNSAQQGAPPDGNSAALHCRR